MLGSDIQHGVGHECGVVGVTFSVTWLRVVGNGCASPAKTNLTGSALC